MQPAPPPTAIPRRLWWVLGLAAVAIVIAGVLAWGRLDEVAGGPRLAVAAGEGRDSDIWAVASDGSDAQRVTSGPDIDVLPAWSPDGEQLAFVRTIDAVAGPPQVVIVAADGGEVRRLGNGTQPAFSPDGATVAWLGGSRAGRAGYEVELAPAAGGEVRRLTDGSGERDDHLIADLDWTPDGTTLVVAQQTTGDRWAVVALPVDGGAARTLAELDGVRALQVTPDGREAIVAATGALVRVPLDGAAASPAVEIGHGGQVRSLDLSPSGQVIALEVAVADASHIEAVGIDGGDGKRLVEEGGGPAFQAAPRYAPDGALVSFAGAADPSGTTERRLYVVTSTGGDARLIESVPPLPYGGAAAWQPTVVG